MDGLVLDVVDGQTHSAILVLHVAEVSECCVVADIVVARDVKACSQLEEVDNVGVEPGLGTHQPACLQRGEETPADTGEAKTIGDFATETGRCLSSKTTLKEVLIAEVVIGIGIPGHVTPDVVFTILVKVVIAGVDVRQFVVTCIMARLVAAVVCKVGVANTCKCTEEVASKAFAPVEVGIGIDAALLGEERADFVCRIAKTGNVEVGHTRHRTEGLLVGAVQGVVEQAVQHKALAQFPFGSKCDIKHGVLLDVLVVAFSILEDGDGVAQRVVARIDIEVGIGVSALQHRRQRSVVVVLVRTEERRFDEGKEARS